jgi:predicted AAA+ superfamily ATPase
MAVRLSGTVKRAVLATVLDRMRDEPVIALEGARAVGKSTLLSQVARHHGVSVLDLDDAETRASVATDPAIYVRAPGPVCIDEYQHVPEILDAIKAELNSDSRPGRYVLTGSTRWDALPRGTQSLTGRLHRVPIRPLSQAELAGTTGLLRSLLSGAARLRTSAQSSTTRAEYVERVIAGGFPLALARRGAGRARWLDDHIANSLERDVRDIAKIRQAANLPRLFERLASQTGQVLNITRAASDIGMDERTAYDYVHLLERLFLVQRLPAWGRTLRRRTAASPKIHIIDTGVAARLLGLSAERLGRANPTSLTEFGHLLETFAYGEIAAQGAWLDEVRAIGHWRTREGDEVDIVVEREDGGVIGIEVKAAAQTTAKNFAGLRKLRELVGDDFVVGLVLHLGQRSTRIDDDLHALPLDRLWTVDSKTS